MKFLLAVLLLIPLLANAQSGIFNDVDPVTGEPTETNSGFNISVTPNDQVAWIYYTHQFEQNLPAPPTVSPRPPDPFDLDDAAGVPTWFLAVSDLFVEQDEILVASGPVYYFPEFDNRDGSEVVVGEFFVVGDTSIPEYAMTIGYAQNEFFAPDYDLYRVYDLVRIVENREE